MVKITSEAAENLNLLNSLIKTIKVISMYPDDHPSLRENVSKNFKLFSKFLAGKNNMTLEISRKRILIDNLNLDESNEIAKEIIDIFFWRRIGSVVFLKNLSYEEFYSFCKLLSLSKDNFEEKEFIEEYIVSHNITHLWINNLSFDELKKKYQEFSGRIVDPAVTEFIQQMSEEKITSDLILKAVSILSKITNPNEYYNFLKKVVGMTRKANLSERKTVEAIIELIKFLSFNFTNQSKHPLIRKFSGEGLRSVASEKILAEMIEIIAKFPAKKATPLINVMGAIGASAIKPTINKIFELQDTRYLVNIARVIKVLGDEAINTLTYYLNSRDSNIILRVLQVLSYLENFKDIHLIKRYVQSQNKEIKMFAYKIILASALKDEIASLMRDLKKAPKSEIVLLLDHLLSSNNVEHYRDMEEELAGFLLEDNPLEIKERVIKFFILSGSKYALTILSSIILGKHPYKKILPEEYINKITQQIFEDSDDHRIKLLYNMLLSGKPELVKFSSVKLGAFSEFYL